MKYYAVRKGLVPGIYATWNECKANTNGYPGAEFKAFTSRKEAEEFIGLTEKTEGFALEPRITDTLTVSNNVPADPDTAVAYVDGSFDTISFRYSYGCYILYNGETYTLNGAGTDNSQEMVGMRNVAGEITGAMTAMRWCMEHDIKKVIIVHDYIGISAWADGSWEAKKENTRCYKTFCQNMRAKGLQISFRKVKGHTGDPGNEMADKLAKEALGL